MAIKAEKITPPPVETEVVLRLPERAARELMGTLMDELVWHHIPYGETTIRAIYDALEAAGVEGV